MCECNGGVFKMSKGANALWLESKGIQPSPAGPYLHGVVQFLTNLFQKWRYTPTGVRNAERNGNDLNLVTPRRCYQFRCRHFGTQ